MLKKEKKVRKTDLSLEKPLLLLSKLPKAKINQLSVRTSQKVSLFCYLFLKILQKILRKKVSKHLPVLEL